MSDPQREGRQLHRARSAVAKLKKDQENLMRALDHALEMDGRDETCPECADARRLLARLRHSSDGEKRG